MHQLCGDGGQSGASLGGLIVPRKPLPLLALLAEFERACAELNVGWYLFGARAA